MDQIRSAAGFEGLIILAVIYFVLNVIAKAKKASQGQKPVAAAGESSPAQTSVAEFSLESILKQIEAVKQQKQHQQPGRTLPPARPKPAPPRMREVTQDARGPMGRTSRRVLQSHEEIEDRTSLEDEGALVAQRRLRSVENFEERPGRVVVDRDDAAAMIAQRRIDLAEARNRPHAALDHAAFDQQVRKPDGAPAMRVMPSVASLREAIVWREILGPPKALQDD